MREYRTAELMDIGIASVIAVVLAVAAAAFVYLRWARLNRPADTTGTSRENERMMELVDVTTHETGGK